MKQRNKLVITLSLTFVGGLKQSTIVGNDANYLQYLSTWLKPVAQSKSSRWKRCWRASVDGGAVSTFHSLCDNKGPTVTIIRVGGKYIFGGYTSLSWGKWLFFFQNWAYQHVKLSKEVFEVKNVITTKRTKKSAFTLFQTLSPLFQFGQFAKWR